MAAEAAAEGSSTNDASPEKAPAAQPAPERPVTRPVQLLSGMSGSSGDRKNWWVSLLAAAKPCSVDAQRREKATKAADPTAQKAGVGATGSSSTRNKPCGGPPHESIREAGTKATSRPKVPEVTAIVTTSHQTTNRPPPPAKKPAARRPALKQIAGQATLAGFLLPSAVAPRGA